MQGGSNSFIRLGAGARRRPANFDSWEEAATCAAWQHRLHMYNIQGNRYRKLFVAYVTEQLHIISLLEVPLELLWQLR